MLIRYFFVLLFSSFVSFLIAQTDYYPPADATGNWETTAPTELNWCQDSIQALYDFLAEEETKAFILLKDGKIVLENYFGTYGQDSLYPWYSAGKSLRSVLLGIAISEGELSLEDPGSTYLGSGWTSLTSQQEDSITVRNLVSMTSGLNELFFFCEQPACRTYRAPAGERWAYHNSPYAVTGGILEAATGMSLNAYTNAKIRQKIGMGFGFWLDFASSQTFYFSKARDMARFGLLVQRNGQWEEEEVVYPETTYFTDMLLPSQSMNPAYGYLWWLNGQASYIGPDGPASFPGALSPAAPADVVLAAGANGQFISISRETGLVMIRQGNSTDESLAPIVLHDLIWARINQLECGPTTTQNPSEKPLLLAYPNPIKNWLTISSTQPNEQLKLYDLMGQFIRFIPSNQRVYVGDLPRGQYIASVNTKNGKQAIKLVLI